MESVILFFTGGYISRPSRTNVLDSIYRIYKIQNGEHVRQDCEINDSFYIDEQAYLLKSIAITYENELHSRNEKTLLEYVKYTYPEIDSFDLVKEKYRPEDLLQNAAPNRLKEVIYSSYEK